MKPKDRPGVFALNHMHGVIRRPRNSDSFDHGERNNRTKGGNHDRTRIGAVAPHVRQRVARRARACRRVRLRALRMRAAKSERRCERRSRSSCRPDRLEPVQRELRRLLRLPVARQGRQSPLHGNGQHRRRRPAGARLPARPFHAPLAQPPRPPDEAHEARRQARRGQVRGDQLGRGHRHHRQRAQAHHRHVRQRGRLQDLRIGHVLGDGQPLVAFAQLVGRLPGRHVRLLDEHALCRTAVSVRRGLRPLRQRVRVFDDRSRAPLRPRGDVRQQPRRNAHGRGEHRVGLRPRARGRQGARRPHRQHRLPPQRELFGPSRRVAAHPPRHRCRPGKRHRARMGGERPNRPRIPAHVLRGLR